MSLTIAVKDLCSLIDQSFTLQGKNFILQQQNFISRKANFISAKQILHAKLLM
jgi:hypothetical protein